MDSELGKEIIELRMALREHVVTCTADKRAKEEWERRIEGMILRLEAAPDAAVRRVESVVQRLQESYQAAFSAMGVQAMQIAAAGKTDEDLKSSILQHIADDTKRFQEIGKMLWKILLSALGGSLLLVGYLFSHLMKWT